MILNNNLRENMLRAFKIILFFMVIYASVLSVRHAAAEAVCTPEHNGACDGFCITRSGVGPYYLQMVYNYGCGSCNGWVEMQDNCGHKIRLERNGVIIYDDKTNYNGGTVDIGPYCYYDDGIECQGYCLMVSDEFTNFTYGGIYQYKVYNYNDDWSDRSCYQSTFTAPTENNKCTDYWSYYDCGPTWEPCTPICTPNCGDTSTRCYYETWSDGCGGTCTGTKPANCGNTATYCQGVSYSGQCATCTGTTPINYQCEAGWNGYQREITGCLPAQPRQWNPSRCLDDAPTARIVSIDCGRIRVQASDPDTSNPVTIRLQYRAPNGGYYTYTTTAVRDTTFTFDQDALARSRGWGTYTWDVDVQNVYPNGAGGNYSYNVSTASYTIYNPADYTDRCDRTYNIFINGDNKTSQLQGDISTGVLTWRSRVKELMLDYDGSLDVEVKADYNSWSVANNRCHTPSQNPTQNTVFAEHLDLDCAIPRAIDLYTVPDENPVELVSEVEFVGTQKKSVDIYADVRCLYKSDELNEGYDEIFNVGSGNIIQPDTGDWRFGDLDACSPGLSLVTVNSEQYTLTAGDNATDCDDSLAAIIYNYILPDQGGTGETENWERLEGTKNIYIDAGARVSEEFKYTGDVITNPPPGFDKFIQPYVSE